MINVEISRGRLMLQRFYAAMVSVLLLGGILAPALPAAEDPELKMLVEEVLTAHDQTSYRATPLIKKGIVGMRAVLDELFPELVDNKEARLKEIAVLIEQLGAEAYERREEATFALRKIGWLAEEPLRQATERADQNIRYRARKILADSNKSFKPQSNYLGLQKYVVNQRDVECRQELARRVTAALVARLDKSGKSRAIAVCLEALSATSGDHAKDDRILNELLPLLKLEDPGPAMMVLSINGGSETYVTPLHKGALASGRPELIRVAIQYMTNPRSDEENRPIIKAALEKYFDGSEIPEELRKDFQFMFRVASMAEEEFQSPNARKWLIGLINSKQPVAIPVMRALGSHGSKLRPMDPVLFAAIETHTKAKDEKYRAAAAKMLEVYEGEGVFPLLAQLFADPVEEVWREAADSLHQRQYSYYQRDKKAIPQVLESALQTAADEDHKARLKYLIKSLQSRNITVLRWQDVE